MLSTKVVVTTLVVDAHEDRVLSTADVVGAYLNTLIDNFMAIKLEEKW